MSSYLKQVIQWEDYELIPQDTIAQQQLVSSALQKIIDRDTHLKDLKYVDGSLSSNLEWRIASPDIMLELNADQGCLVLLHELKGEQYRDYIQPMMLQVMRAFMRVAREVHQLYFSGKVASYSASVMERMSDKSLRKLVGLTWPVHLGQPPSTQEEEWINMLFHKLPASYFLPS